MEGESYNQTAGRVKIAVELRVLIVDKVGKEWP